MLPPGALSRSELKTTFPSGLQPQTISAPGCQVSRFGSPPAAGIIYTSVLPWYCPVKAIVLPSAENFGLLSVPVLGFLAYWCFQLKREAFAYIFAALVGLSFICTAFVTDRQETQLVLLAGQAGELVLSLSAVIFFFAKFPLFKAWK